MALLWILSPLLVCATSSATNGLHDSLTAFQNTVTVRTASDSLAAFQDTVPVRTARASQLQHAAPRDPVNGLSAAGDAPEPEGELEGLSAAGDQPEPQGELEGQSEPKDELDDDENVTKDEKRRKFTIGYTVSQREPGFKMDLALGYGCNDAPDGERDCKFNILDKNNSGRVSYDLAEEADDRSVFNLNISVRALLLAFSTTSVQCPVCGHECTIKLFFVTGVLQMPPCPWKVGHRSFSASFAEIVQRPRVPWGLVVRGSIEAVRPNGSVIMAGAFHGGG